MSDNLSLLVKLQKLDLKIDESIRNREDLSSKIQELERGHLKLEEELLNKERQLKDIKKERRGRERNIEEIDSALAKYEEEKYKVKSQEDFTTIEREINQAERKKVEVEDLVLELMEREEELTNYFPFFKEETKRKRKSLREQREALEKDLKSLIYKEENLRSERERTVSQLDSVLLSQYEQLCKTKDGLAVAPIKNEVCEGCNVGVSPSLIGRVRRGEIIYCESCNRILYIADRTKT